MGRTKAERFWAFLRTLPEFQEKFLPLENELADTLSQALNDVCIPRSVVSVIFRMMVLPLSDFLDKHIEKVTASFNQLNASYINNITNIVIDGIMMEHENRNIPKPARNPKFAPLPGYKLPPCYASEIYWVRKTTFCRNSVALLTNGMYIYLTNGPPMPGDGGYVRMAGLVTLSENEPKRCSYRRIIIEESIDDILNQLSEEELYDFATRSTVIYEWTEEDRIKCGCPLCVDTRHRKIYCHGKVRPAQHTLPVEKLMELAA